VGTVLGLAGHVLAVGAAFFAAWLTPKPEGHEFEDLAVGALTFAASELVLSLACLIGGAVLVTRHRRPAGVGLVVGWALGAAALVVALRLVA
jgi:hypothetical protein